MTSHLCSKLLWCSEESQMARVISFVVDAKATTWMGKCCWERGCLQISCGVAACKAEGSRKSRNSATGAAEAAPPDWHRRSSAALDSGSWSGWVMLQSNIEMSNFHVTAAPSPVHRNVQDPVRIRRSFLGRRSNRFCAFSEENSPSHSVHVAETAHLDADAWQHSRHRSVAMMQDVAHSSEIRRKHLIETRPALRPWPSEDGQIFGWPPTEVGVSPKNPGVPRQGESDSSCLSQSAWLRALMNSCSDATSVHQVRQTRHKCQIRRKRFFTSPLRVRRNFVSCWAEVQWATRLPLSSPQVNATQRSDVSRTNPPKRSDFRDEMFATNRRFNQFVRCRKRQPTPCLTYAESQSCLSHPRVWQTSLYPAPLQAVTLGIR